jgi:hypothetical protein
MRHSEDERPYRIGLGRDAYDLQRLALLHDWFGFRYRLKMAVRSARRRSWWGIWQAEWPGCQHAVRGITYQGTAIKAARARLPTIGGQ